MRIKQIITGAVSFWMFAIFYSMATINRREYEFGRLIVSEGDRTFLVVSAPILILAGLLLFLWYRQIIFYLLRKDHSFLFLGIVFSLIFFVSLFHWNYESVLYLVLFISTIITALYLNLTVNSRFFFLASIATIGMLFAFVVIHGPPDGRSIGGIHPNQIGAFSLLATFFAARSMHSARWLIYAVALGFAIVVSSRSAGIAVLIIMLVDYTSGLSRMNLLRAFFITIFSSLLLVFVFLLFDWLTSWLELDSPSRGVGSGFTGRVEMMSAFLPQAMEKPFFGYGFRQRENYQVTHNGFLNFTLENGFIIAATFVLVIFSALLTCVKRIRDKNADSREPLILIGFFLAWGFNAFFEPQIVNFGDAFGVMTMFLLTAHAKWIMKVKAPESVSIRSPMRQSSA